MKRNKFTVFLVIICILSLFNVEVKTTVTVNWNDFPRHTTTPPVNHAVPLRICPSGILDMKVMGCEIVPIGESKELDGDVPIKIWKQSTDEFIPIPPKRHVKVTFRRFTATKPEPMLCIIVLGQQKERRRVMLHYPPAGTVWHTPGGVSMLTSFLRKDGHDVRQRWGHIIGLEYMLLAQNQKDVSRALNLIKSTDSDVVDLYEARRIFERTSEKIQTSDKFRFERNNVIYQSQYQDGSIAGALKAIADRKNHFWYPYFSEVELPVVRDFNPHVYGVSVNDERQLFPGLVLASMVKELLPGTVVVVGGNFFGRIPDPQDYPDFVQLFDHLDAVVYAEGFQPLQTITETLDVSQATGTIWRNAKGNNSEVVKNPRTSSPTEFETLPPPALDGDAHQWSPEVIATLYTKSHCPEGCTYCAIAAVSDTFAAGRLNEEPKAKPRSMCPRTIALHMQSLGLHKFDLVDELFSIGYQIQLGKELRAIGHEATWQCYLTITDNLLNPKTAQDLYAAGCRSVQLGLETLRPETLLQVQKQWNHPTGYDRILQNFRDAGIHTHVFLMIGLPNEPLYEGLRWVGFIEKYGRNILTIKSGRWRPARYAPEVEKNLFAAHVELYPDTKPFQTNRSFRYRNATHSNTKVDAMRDIVEQACRRHWAYNVTSTIPWWINRSRYTWEQLEEMAKQLPSEPDIPHLDDRIAQMRYLVRTELGREANFRTWDELAAFAVTLL